jgi:hypothetical protein
MTPITIQERISHLAGLLAREREALAEVISELADFDQRRCWEELGYPSLFEFLTRELRLSRGAAFYRTKAVWLVQRFPEVLPAIREGKLYINSIAEVARVLTPENLPEVLPRFFHLPREDAKLLSAELAPREVVPIREVVTRTEASAPPLELGPSTPMFALVSPPSDLASPSPIHIGERQRLQGTGSKGPDSRVSCNPSRDDGTDDRTAQPAPPHGPPSAPRQDRGRPAKRRAERRPSRT